MKKLMNVLPLLLVVVLLFGTACQSNKKKDAESVNVTLFDKDLPEIKTLVNGEWELVSGKNAREFCEYENTFIKFGLPCVYQRGYSYFAGLFGNRI